MASATIKRVRLGEVISPAAVVKCGTRNLPVLSMTMHDGLMLQSDRFKKKIASMDLSGYKVVAHNQLVVSFPIDEGVLSVQDVVDEGVVSPAYAIWNVNEDMVLPKFLETFLRCPISIDFYKSKLRGSTARRRTIPKETFLSMLMPAYSLAEQKRIAATLDKISEMKRNAEARLQKLDLLVKSRFNEMFGDVRTNSKGWRKERLESHVDVLTGFPFESAGYVESGGVRVCGGLIIMPGYVDWRGCRRWPGSHGVETFLLESGDIVMALDRPWVSAGFKIAQLKEKDLPALLVQRTARIRGLDVDQRFLLSLLEDKAFESHCTVTGSLVPHISHKDIKSYEVIIPPLSLQRSFAAFVEKVEALKATAQASLERVDLLYRAKLQEYFG